MSYPQQGGYPQQPYPQQQPYQAEPSGGGGGNPVTAILAALFALGCAAFEIILIVNWLEVLDGQLGEAPADLLVQLGVQALATLLLVLGSILLLLRKTAGAVLTIIGSVVAIAGFFLEPLLGAERAPDIGAYIEAVFQFSSSAATYRALVAIGAVLALIFAVLPPTFKYLRGKRNDDYQQYPPSGGYPANPNSGGFQQQGYPADPGAQGYPANPNSGGFPQQGYPQQGGYPQQQQGGGYPQQQGW